MANEHVGVINTFEEHDETRIPKAQQNTMGDVLFNNNPAENELFDGNILKLVQLHNRFPSLPSNLQVRPLHVDDWKKGYLTLLEQLTIVGHVSETNFKERFHSMTTSSPPMYYVIVLEDVTSQRLVGTITLVIEFKFIHAAGLRGRVEDLVVDSRMRGKKLGEILSLYAIELARLLGVYKLSLECKDKLVTYYEKFGYIKDPGNNFMVQRFDGICL